MEPACSISPMPTQVTARRAIGRTSPRDGLWAEIKPEIAAVLADSFQSWFHHPFAERTGGGVPGTARQTTARARPALRPSTALPSCSKCRAARLSS